MNRSLSIIASLGIGIVIGILLEKQFRFEIDFNIGNSIKGNAKDQSKSEGTLYNNKSGTYQDQPKSGKSKELTRKRKVRNTE